MSFQKSEYVLVIALLLITSLVKAQCPTVTTTIFPYPANYNSTIYSCTGNTFNMGFSSNITNAVTTYTYTASNISGGLTGAASGTGSGISQVLNCPGPGLCAVSYAITPFANGCQGETVGRTVYVVPPSQVIASDKTICSEETFVLSTTATFGTPYFLYSVDYSSNITGNRSENSNYMAHNSAQPIGTNERIVNTSNSVGYAVYTITPYFDFQPYGACTGTPRTITVTVKPAPTVNALEDVNVCADETFSRTLSTNLPDPATFSWAYYHPDSNYPAFYSGNPLTRSILNSTNAPQTSRFHIKATVNGCTGAERILYATIKPRPVLTTFWAGRPYGSSVSTADRNFGSGTPDNIPLTANVSGSTFTWPTPGMLTGTTGGTAGSGNTISQTLYYSGSTHGTATYTVTPTAAGCVGTPSTCFVYVWPATPSSITASGSTSFCKGGSVVLTAAHLSGNTYAWKRNGNTIAGATSSTLTVTEPGDYWVMTMNSAYGYGYSGKSNTITVAVSGNDPYISISPVAILSSCQSSSSILKASPGSSYTWYKNDQPIWYDQSLNLPGPGKYYVKVTNPTGCQSGTLTSNSVIIESDFQVSISGNSSACPGAMVELTATLSAGYHSNGRTKCCPPENIYLWSTGEYGSSVFVYPGTYSVTVTNALTGCTSVASFNVATANCGPPPPPPNPCGTSARCEEPQSLTAFPNPADDELTLTLKAPAEADYPVLLNDVTGKKAIETKFQKGNSELKIPVRHIPGGTYVVRTLLHNRIDTKKVIIVHKN